LAGKPAKTGLKVSSPALEGGAGGWVLNSPTVSIIEKIQNMVLFARKTGKKYQKLLLSPYPLAVINRF